MPLNTYHIFHYHTHFIFRPVTEEDIENIEGYLNAFHPETKKRFHPHAYTSDAIRKYFKAPKEYIQYLAIEKQNGHIAAYFIVRHGWLDHETDRYNSYGLTGNNHDYSLAPSVADIWQGKGLGKLFFEYVKTDLYKQHPCRRIFLWGGVQKDNKRAIGFYKQLGFKKIGQFEYKGINIDMVQTLA
jgi:ribosomal protein S18 acetylase RimI-like enzyme